MYKNDLISIIMSTYNESEEELLESVNSILEQTYNLIELIIINDNPQNTSLMSVLDKIKEKDSRVQVFVNEKNIGLVESLNKALFFASGNYIARMDADDISEKARLSVQLECLKKEKLDLVGSNIKLINEKNQVLGLMSFPTDCNKIKFFLKWGTCIPHPTWLCKREVYDSLMGYRHALYCEDYDFLLRAVTMGFRLGNCKLPCLKYRIRPSSVSHNHNAEQYILRRYLYKNRRNIIQLSNEQITTYLNSKAFMRETIKIEKFFIDKESIKNSVGSLGDVKRMIFNKYTYIMICEKFALKLRGIVS